jgi:hypothetical protein|tara:strand:- start:820 stop:1041 length:222 start_codon:yes stop_codon:yes gene_type:complete
MKQKSMYFFQGKKGMKQTSSIISITSLHKKSNNGGKQKRDADFTETATQEKTFMLRGLVFDLVRIRVEKSIDR